MAKGQKHHSREPAQLTRGAELLYRYRVAKQLSQPAFARIIKAHPRTISFWECGRKIPELNHAVRMELASHGAIPCGAWLCVLSHKSKALGSDGVAMAKELRSLLGG